MTAALARCQCAVLLLAAGCQGCQGGPPDSDLPPANDAAAPLDVGVDAWVRDAGDDIWDAAPPVWDGFVEPIGFPDGDERGGFFGDQLGEWTLRVSTENPDAGWEQGLAAVGRPGAPFQGLIQLEEAPIPGFSRWLGHILVDFDADREGLQLAWMEGRSTYRRLVGTWRFERETARASALGNFGGVWRRVSPPGDDDCTFTVEGGALAEEAGRLEEIGSLTLPTQILTPEKLKQVVEQNPFLSRPDFVENKMYVTFLDAIPAVVPEVGSLGVRVSSKACWLDSCCVFRSSNSALASSPSSPPSLATVLAC